MKGLVFAIEEMAVHDGPGLRTTVFLKGCPLRCQWCHNPEGWEPRPQRVRNPNGCTGCGACVRNCPAGNFAIAEGRAEPGGSCMLCYRCVNRCPEKAIRVVYRRPVAKQYGGIAAENGGEAAS